MFYIDSNIIYLASKNQANLSAQYVETIMVSHVTNHTSYRDIRVIEYQKKLPLKEFIIKQSKSGRLCWNSNGDLFYSLDEFKPKTTDPSLKLFAIKPLPNSQYVIGDAVYIKSSAISIAPQNFKVKIKVHSL